MTEAASICQQAASALKQHELHPYYHRIGLPGIQGIEAVLTILNDHYGFSCPGGLFLAAVDVMLEKAPVVQAIKQQLQQCMDASINECSPLIAAVEASQGANSSHADIADEAAVVHQGASMEFADDGAENRVDQSSIEQPGKDYSQLEQQEHPELHTRQDSCLAAMLTEGHPLSPGHSNLHMHAQGLTSAQTSAGSSPQDSRPSSLPPDNAGSCTRPALHAAQRDSVQPDSHAAHVHVPANTALKSSPTLTKSAAKQGVQQQQQSEDHWQQQQQLQALLFDPPSEVLTASLAGSLQHIDLLTAANSPQQIQARMELQEELSRSSRPSQLHFRQPHHQYGKRQELLSTHGHQQGLQSLQKTQRPEQQLGSPLSTWQQWQQRSAAGSALAYKSSWQSPVQQHMLPASPLAVPQPQHKQPLLSPPLVPPHSSSPVGTPLQQTAQQQQHIKEHAPPEANTPSQSHPGAGISHQTDVHGSVVHQQQSRQSNVQNLQQLAGIMQPVLHDDAAASEVLSEWLSGSDVAVADSHAGSEAYGPPFTSPMLTHAESVASTTAAGIAVSPPVVPHALCFTPPAGAAGTSTWHPALAGNSALGACTPLVPSGLSPSAAVQLQQQWMHAAAAGLTDCRSGSMGWPSGNGGVKGLTSSHRVGVGDHSIDRSTRSTAPAALPAPRTMNAESHRRTRDEDEVQSLVLDIDLAKVLNSSGTIVLQLKQDESGALSAAAALGPPLHELAVQPGAADGAASERSTLAAAAHAAEGATTSMNPAPAEHRDARSAAAATKAVASPVCSGLKRLQQQQLTCGSISVDGSLHMASSRGQHVEGAAERCSVQQQDQPTQRVLRYSAESLMSLAGVGAAARSQGDAPSQGDGASSEAPQAACQQQGHGGPLARDGVALGHASKADCGLQQQQQHMHTEGAAPTSAVSMPRPHHMDAASWVLVDIQPDELLPDDQRLHSDNSGSVCAAVSASIQQQSEENVLQLARASITPIRTHNAAEQELQLRHAEAYAVPEQGAQGICSSQHTSSRHMPALNPVCFPKQQCMSMEPPCTPVYASVDLSRRTLQNTSDCVELEAQQFLPAAAAAECHTAAPYEGHSEQAEAHTPVPTTVGQPPDNTATVSPFPPELLPTETPAGFKFWGTSRAPPGAARYLTGGQQTLESTSNLGVPAVCQTEHAAAAAGCAAETAQGVSSMVCMPAEQQQSQQQQRQHASVLLQSMCLLGLSAVARDHWGLENVSMELLDAAVPAAATTSTPAERRSVNAVQLLRQSLAMAAAAELFQQAPGRHQTGSSECQAPVLKSLELFLPQQLSQPCQVPSDSAAGDTRGAAVTQPLTSGEIEAAGRDQQHRQRSPAEAPGHQQRQQHGHGSPTFQQGRQETLMTWLSSRFGTDPLLRSSVSMMLHELEQQQGPQLVSAPPPCRSSGGPLHRQEAHLQASQPDIPALQPAAWHVSQAQGATAAAQGGEPSCWESGGVTGSQEVPPGKMCAPGPGNSGAAAPADEEQADAAVAPSLADAPATRPQLPAPTATCDNNYDSEASEALPSACGAHTSSTMTAADRSAAEGHTTRCVAQQTRSDNQQQSACAGKDKQLQSGGNERPLKQVDTQARPHLPADCHETQQQEPGHQLLRQSEADRVSQKPAQPAQMPDHKLHLPGGQQAAATQPWESPRNLQELAARQKALPSSFSARDNQVQQVLLHQDPHEGVAVEMPSEFTPHLCSSPPGCDLALETSPAPHHDASSRAVAEDSMLNAVHSTPSVFRTSVMTNPLFWVEHSNADMAQDSTINESAGATPGDDPLSAEHGESTLRSVDDDCRCSSSRGTGDLASAVRRSAIYSSTGTWTAAAATLLRAEDSPGMTPGAHQGEKDAAEDAAAMLQQYLPYTGSVCSSPNDVVTCRASEHQSLLQMQGQLTEAARTQDSGAPSVGLAGAVVTSDKSPGHSTHLEGQEGVQTHEQPLPGHQVYCITGSLDLVELVTTGFNSSSLPCAGAGALAQEDDPADSGHSNVHLTAGGAADSCHHVTTKRSPHKGSLYQLFCLAGDDAPTQSHTQDWPTTAAHGTAAVSAEEAELAPGADLSQAYARIHLHERVADVTAACSSSNSDLGASGATHAHHHQLESLHSQDPADLHVGPEEYLHSTYDAAAQQQEELCSVTEFLPAEVAPLGEHTDAAAAQPSKQQWHEAPARWAVARDVDWTGAAQLGCARQAGCWVPQTFWQHRSDDDDNQDRTSMQLLEQQDQWHDDAPRAACSKHTCSPHISALESDRSADMLLPDLAEPPVQSSGSQRQLQQAQLYEEDRQPVPQVQAAQPGAECADPSHIQSLMLKLRSRRQQMLSRAPCGDVHALPSGQSTQVNTRSNPTGSEGCPSNPTIAREQQDAVVVASSDGQQAKRGDPPKQTARDSAASGGTSASSGAAHRTSGPATHCVDEQKRSTAIQPGDAAVSRVQGRVQDPEDTLSAAEAAMQQALQQVQLLQVQAQVQPTQGDTAAHQQQQQHVQDDLVGQQSQQPCHLHNQSAEVLNSPVQSSTLQSSAAAAESILAVPAGEDVGGGGAADRGDVAQESQSLQLVRDILQGSKTISAYVQALTGQGHRRDIVSDTGVYGAAQAAPYAGSAVLQGPAHSQVSLPLLQHASNKMADGLRQQVASKMAALVAAARTGVGAGGMLASSSNSRDSNSDGNIGQHLRDTGQSAAVPRSDSRVSEPAAGPWSAKIQRLLEAADITADCLLQAPAPPPQLKHSLHTPGQAAAATAPDMDLRPGQAATARRHTTSTLMRGTAATLAKQRSKATKQQTHATKPVGDTSQHQTHAGEPRSQATTQLHKMPGNQGGMAARTASVSEPHAEVTATLAAFDSSACATAQQQADKQCAPHKEQQRRASQHNTSASVGSKQQQQRPTQAETIKDARAVTPTAMQRKHLQHLSQRRLLQTQQQQSSQQQQQHGAADLMPHRNPCRSQQAAHATSALCIIGDDTQGETRQGDTPREHGQQSVDAASHPQKDTGKHKADAASHSPKGAVKNSLDAAPHPPKGAVKQDINDAPHPHDKGAVKQHGSRVQSQKGVLQAKSPTWSGRQATAVTVQPASQPAALPVCSMFDVPRLKGYTFSRAQALAAAGRNAPGPTTLGTTSAAVSPQDGSHHHVPGTAACAAAKERSRRARSTTETTRTVQQPCSQPHRSKQSSDTTARLRTQLQTTQANCDAEQRHTRSKCDFSITPTRYMSRPSKAEEQRQEAVAAAGSAKTMHAPAAMSTSARHVSLCHEHCMLQAGESSGSSQQSHGLSLRRSARKETTGSAAGRLPAQQRLAARHSSTPPLACMTPVPDHQPLLQQPGPPRPVISGSPDQHRALRLTLPARGNGTSGGAAAAVAAVKASLAGFGTRGWQQQDTHHWLSQLRLDILPEECTLPLLDNPLRNGLLLAGIAAATTRRPLPGIHQPVKTLAAARSNLLTAAAHLGLISNHFAAEATAAAAQRDREVALGHVDQASQGPGPLLNCKLRSPGHKSAPGSPVRCSRVSSSLRARHALAGHSPHRSRSRSPGHSCHVSGSTYNSFCTSSVAWDADTTCTCLAAVAAGPGVEGHVSSDGVDCEAASLLSRPAAAWCCECWACHQLKGTVLEHALLHLAERLLAGDTSTLWALLYALQQTFPMKPTDPRTASPVLRQAAVRPAAEHHPAGTKLRAAALPRQQRNLPEVNVAGRGSRGRGTPPARPSSRPDRPGPATHTSNPHCSSSRGGCIVVQPLQGPSWRDFQMGYTAAELTGLEQRLLQWMESLDIVCTYDTPDFASIGTELCSGTLLLEVAAAVGAPSVVAVTERPMTAAARTSNLRALLQAVQTLPGLKCQSLLQEHANAVLRGERLALTALLEALWVWHTGREGHWLRRTHQPQAQVSNAWLRQ